MEIARQKVIEFYDRGGFEDYARRVDGCDRAFWFCRVRGCPICQLQRMRKWKVKAYQLAQQVAKEYPTHRWLLATFTQKNVPPSELRESLTELNSAFRRLNQRKSFPAIGWVKSIEVTRDRHGKAHPHIHALLLVPPSYFGKKYLKHEKWANLWKESLRVDYMPQVNIKPVSTHALGETLLEASKLVSGCTGYITKPSAVTDDQEWFLECARQLHKTRMIAGGGIFRDILREMEWETVFVFEPETGDAYAKRIRRPLSKPIGWKHPIPSDS